MKKYIRLPLFTLLGYCSSPLWAAQNEETPPQVSALYPEMLPHKDKGILVQALAQNASLTLALPKENGKLQGIIKKEQGYLLFTNPHDGKDIYMKVNLLLKKKKYPIRFKSAHNKNKLWINGQQQVTIVLDGLPFDLKDVLRYFDRSAVQFSWNGNIKSLKGITNHVIEIDQVKYSPSPLIKTLAIIKQKTASLQLTKVKNIKNFTKTMRITSPMHGWDFTFSFLEKNGKNALTKNQKGILVKLNGHLFYIDYLLYVARPMPQNFDGNASFAFAIDDMPYYIENVPPSAARKALTYGDLNKNDIHPYIPKSSIKKRKSAKKKKKKKLKKKENKPNTFIAPEEPPQPGSSLSQTDSPQMHPLKSIDIPEDSLKANEREIEPVPSNAASGAPLMIGSPFAQQGLTHINLDAIDEASNEDDQTEGHPTPIKEIPKEVAEAQLGTLTKDPSIEDDLSEGNASHTGDGISKGMKVKDGIILSSSDEEDTDDDQVTTLLDERQNEKENFTPPNAVRRQIKIPLNPINDNRPIEEYHISKEENSPNGSSYYYEENFSYREDTAPFQEEAMDNDWLWWTGLGTLFAGSVGTPIAVVKRKKNEKVDKKKKKETTKQGNKKPTKKEKKKKNPIQPSSSVATPPQPLKAKKERPKTQV